jgi:hypothetical protein
MLGNEIIVSGTSGSDSNGTGYLVSGCVGDRLISSPRSMSLIRFLPADVMRVFQSARAALDKRIVY